MAVLFMRGSHFLPSPSVHMQPPSLNSAAWLAPAFELLFPHVTPFGYVQFWEAISSW